MTPTSSQTDRGTGVLAGYAAKYRAHLNEILIPLWLRHAPDREHGGYLTCFDQQWRLYDDRKYMWLQGRLVWMFGRLYNQWDRKPEYLEAASVGIPLILSRGRDEYGRIFFSLTRDGKPLHYQRKPYSAVFCQMGLLEYYRATGDEACRQEAVLLFDRILHWIQNPSTLGRPHSAGPALSSLANVMVIACMALELNDAFPENPRYLRIIREQVAAILRHLHPSEQVLMENIALDEQSHAIFTEWPDARLFNPGHSIEVAWFLLHLLDRLGNDVASDVPIRVLANSFRVGWDRDYGGFYNFMDIEDRPCLQPEANMKYFWPLNEALYAATLAWQRTGDKAWLEWIERVDTYMFDRLVDKERGGWFGYLDRRGDLALASKGGNYMSFFHVPRSLMMTARLIETECL